MRADQIKNEKKLNVLIVGCGNIAGRFDMLNPSNNYAQTHAGAYTNNSNFNVNACIEPDVGRREEFMAHWNIEYGYSDFTHAMSSSGNFDVISICSPTDQHANDVLAAIDLKPKIIFCEKPISSNLLSSKDVVLACEDSGIVLAVNYSRRWDPRLHDFKYELDAGKYGELRSVVGLYSKGVLNNGSHLIDLLQLLLGELVISSIGTNINDYLEDDPSISAILLTDKKIPIHLVTGHAMDYSLFEIQFIFENCMVTMLDGGAQWVVRYRKESELYAGYYSLDSGVTSFGGYSMAMENAVNNIYSHLNRNEKLLSVASNSLQAQKLCEDLINHKLNSGGL